MSGPSGAPIPIESLTAVGKNDPRVQMNFDGQTLPRAPSTRRVKPRPFSRQRIDLDRHGRAWTNCRADAIEVGEMVVGVGRVAQRELKTRYEPYYEVCGLVPGVDFPADDPPLKYVRPVAVGTDVVLTGMGGNVVTYDAETFVQTFRKADAT